jgi:hypothetical protein
MNLGLLDRVGEWNPQLFRELKGKLKPRNLIVTIAISMVGQLILLMSFASQLPAVDPTQYGGRNMRYCLRALKNRSQCLLDSFGNPAIDWQLWMWDVFLWLSIIGIFGMLVVGTYLLISDLSKEEHRSTLNFIRLSPRSSQNILLGKLVGVPILLYIAAGLAIPLHLWLGLAANIPLSLILGFYSILIASCIFFYSLSLLYGLVSTGLRGFQPWLGSGLLLMFLFATNAIASSSYQRITHSPFDGITIFSPSFFLPYLVDSISPPLAGISSFQPDKLESLPWLGLPLSANAASFGIFMLLNYSLWTIWAWQGLQRRFPNPSASVFGKKQSYLLTACFEIFLVGFALVPKFSDYRIWDDRIFDNFSAILVFNVLWFLGLIAALSPHRQALQDWARYRHQKRSVRQQGNMADLLWSEKSPAVVAVGINLAIANIIMTLWVLTWGSDRQNQALIALFLSTTFLLICAAVAQLMLLMKTPKRFIWAASTVSGLIILPPIILGLLSISPEKIPGIWLVSGFAWAAIQEASVTAIFLAVIGECLALTLLGLQLKRQLRQTGESTSRSLLAGARI